jgi:hypothetical protein
MISGVDLQNDYVRVSRVELQTLGVNTKGTKEKAKVTENSWNGTASQLSPNQFIVVLFSVTSCVAFVTFVLTPALKIQSCG